MIGEPEFERLLTSWLEADGPQDVPAGLVDGALTAARRERQAGGWADALRGRRWPVDPGGIWSPAGRRVLTIVMVALATIAFVGVGALAGAAIVDRISTSPIPSAPPTAPVPTRAAVVREGAPRFTATGTMAVPRQYPTLVRLLNGRVLALGGDGDEGAVAEVEIYDPVTGTFGVAGAMPSLASGFSATLLDDGRVLIAGGTRPRQGPPSDAVAQPTPALLPSAWLYDPTTGAFAPTGQMNAGRSDHMALKLSDGRVLVVDDAGGSEVYDPRTAGWTTLPNGPEARRRSTPRMVLLGDGRVLRMGGYGSAILDPSTGSWTEAGPSHVLPGVGWTLTPLPDGSALVAGGEDDAGRGQLDAERYDPIANAFRSTTSMPSAFTFPMAVALSDGRVLLLDNPDDGSGQAALYDPVSESFSLVSDPARPSRPQAAMPLDDGRVLIVQDGELDNLIFDPQAKEAP